MPRHALMIGIDHYAHLRADFQLRGCVNDQHLLKQLLVERFAFPAEGVHQLINEEATREAILQAMDRLAGINEGAGASPVQPGDLVLLSYSGHGSRLKEPPDQRDEPDGYDSTLVPHDSDRPRPAGKGGPNIDITDDEIFDRLQAIKERVGPTGHVVLYFDCCHSGTISRDLEGGMARSLPDDDRYGAIDRPRLQARDLAAPQPKGRSGWLPMSEGYVLIAGCADDEKAREYRDPQSGESFGALTFHLVREMRQAEGPRTYRDVFEPARRAVTTLFTSQHPQMEGDWSHHLFGLEAVPVEPFAPVLERRGEQRLTLAAGAAHGTTVGSRWAIEPAESGDRQTLAEVTIAAVGPLSSVATSEAPLPATVQPGCRAIEIERNLGDFRVAVAVDGTDSAELNRLREAIRGSSLLTLASEGAVERMAILLPPRTASEARDELAYAPELGAVERPTWVIVGADRRLLATPPHAADEPEVIARTLANLETWARYLNIQRLRPPADPFGGKVTIRLEALDEADNASPLPEHDPSGLPLVQAESSVQVVIENQHNRPLFFTLFRLDATGAVERLYPPLGAQEALAPFDHYNDLALTLHLPDHFPAQLREGRESLKVMLSARPVDFNTLAQEGSRDDDHAARLLLNASQGRATATTVQVRAANEEAWGIAQVDYILQRP